MGEVIQHVTTPLALAAVALLAGAGILQAAIKKRTSVALKMIIRYGFGLAIALSVMANASYIFLKWSNSESIISGIVRDPSGKALSRAVVDVPGVGRGITDDDGSFTIAVPRSRRHATYELTTTMNGFEPNQVNLTDRETEGVTISLQAVVLTAQKLINISSDLLVAHFVGLPEVDVPIRLYNPTSAPVQVKDFLLEVKSPEGTSVEIPPYSTYMSRGMPPMPLLAQVEVTPGQTFEAVWIFLEQDVEVAALTQRVNFDLEAHPAFFQTGPQQGQAVLSPITAEIVGRFMDNKFIWKPGTWKFDPSVSADGSKYLREGSFNLTDSQVSEMRNIRQYFSFGYGLNFVTRLLPVGNALPGHYIQMNGLE